MSIFRLGHFLLTGALLWSAVLWSGSARAQDYAIERTREGGRARGREAGIGLPQFAAFPLSGAGSSSVCSVVAPTGERGEVMTFTRASSATCTKTAAGGLAVAGILDGDLVTLSTNVARVEYDNDGTLGLRKTAARTDSALQGEELCDVAWIDVGTPACAADQSIGPWGTTTMDSITDNDGAAYEGRAQVILDTNLTKHGVACYVKSSTATAASITLVGTGNSTGDCTGTVTGLVAGSSKRVFCISPAVYTVGLTAVTVTIAVGSVIADEGVLLVESCDHFTDVDSAPGIPDTIRTTSAAVTQATEGVPSWLTNIAAGSNASAAATITTNFVPTSLTTLAAPPASGNPELLGRFSGGNFGCYMRTPGTDLAAGTWVAGANRWSCSGSRHSALGATTASGASTFFTGATTAFGIGSSGGFGAAIDGIYSRLCFDPDPARCR